MKRPEDKQIEIWIGWVLRIGTAVSCSIAAIGISWYLVLHGSAATSYGEFHPEQTRLPSLHAVVAAALGGNSNAIIQIAILLLIATPLARVAFLVGAYALERDRLYVGVSSLVLAILLYSIFFAM